jgi:hypothetical protein
VKGGESMKRLFSIFGGFVVMAWNMKKLFCIFVFAVILGGTLYAQTWTTRDNSDGTEEEYTIITKEEFNRLKRQYEARMSYCFVYPSSGTAGFDFTTYCTVIKGQVPKINGYYYMVKKTNWDTRPKIWRDIQLRNRSSDMLFYGYEQGGWGRRMTLDYYEKGGVFGTIPINSAEYRSAINQAMDFVEGR